MDRSSAEDFMARMVQLVQPQRLDVFLAVAQIHASHVPPLARKEFEELLLRDSFRLHAGLQGFKSLVWGVRAY